MNEKRFIQLGDTHIKDTITGEEWYAPCETSLLETLNELMTQCHELKEENEYLKKRNREISDELYCKDRKLEELGVPIECCDKK